MFTKFFYLLGFLATVSLQSSVIKLYYGSEKKELNETNADILDVNKKIVFLIHGWQEDSTTSDYSRMFEEYATKGGKEVIRVDWGHYAFQDYFSAKNRVPEVGKFIGNYIIVTNLTNVHLVGFSLGAHAAGCAGKYVKKYNKIIQRITCLDPAGPFYDFIPFSDAIKLTKNDAEMVDCFCTNRILFGSKENHGTVNINVNDANHQPGCPYAIIKKEDRTCSHYRSLKLFIESINSLSLIAYGKYPNTDEVVVGENMDLNAAAGDYYLKTNCSAPYGLGKNYEAEVSC